MDKTPISALVLIHTSDLQVLIMERTDKAGFWQSVTGSVEGDETPYEAAIREVKEETGLNALAYDFQDWQALPSTMAVTLAPEEHTHYEWVDWRDAAQRVFSWTNVDALRRLGDQHNKTL